MLETPQEIDKETRPTTTSTFPSYRYLHRCEMEKVVFMRARSKEPVARRANMTGRSDPVVPTDID